jgi:hypothetical protein
MQAATQLDPDRFDAIEAQLGALAEGQNRVERRLVRMMERWDDIEEWMARLVDERQA